MPLLVTLVIYFGTELRSLEDKKLLEDGDTLSPILELSVSFS